MSEPWRLNVLERNGLSLIPDDLRYFGDHFIGEPMSATWEGPPGFTISRKSGKLNDFLVFHTAVPVVSGRVLTVLQSLSKDNFEAFDLISIRNRPYFAINVIAVADCVDFIESDIRFYGTPNYGIPRRIVIRQNAELPRGIFKMNKIPGYVFVSDDLAERISLEGFTGFCLTKPSTDVLSMALRGEMIDEYSVVNAEAGKG